MNGCLARVQHTCLVEHEYGLLFDRNSISENVILEWYGLYLVVHSVNKFAEVKCLEGFQDINS